MTGVQHLIIGSTWGFLGSVALYTMDANIGMGAIGFLGLSALGSILPDIDNPQAMMGQKVPFLSRMIYSLVGHRSYTHSVLLWSIIGYLAYSRSPIWVMGLFLGVFSHLIMDAMTVNGVPLFCLWTKSRNWNRHFHVLPKFLRCRCGSFWSYVLTFLTMIGSIVGFCEVLTA